MNIDTETYNKLALYPPGKQDPPHSYDAFNRGYAGIRLLPKSIVIHTTNGNKGTSFEAEANFIYRSQKISAHYLVGKKGQVAEFLSPHIVAYHAGEVWPLYRFFGNPYSIGIECHFTPGETWTLEQKKALFDLCRTLVHRYNITMIETHRKVARPQGRKVDPSGFPDDEFYAFVRNVLYNTTLTKYVTVVNANVRKEPTTRAAILRTIPKNSEVSVSSEVKGETYRGHDDWCTLAEGGYIWKDLLRVS